MEYTKETAVQFVRGVLIRNGFTQVSDTLLVHPSCNLEIGDTYYKVSHYDRNFLEWVDWFSPDLTIYGLIGYLSWNNFIERGYEV